MTIYLDDQPVELTGERLADVLEAASSHLGKGARMIVEVQLDGQALAGDELTRRLTGPVAGDAELRLYSAEPRALGMAALEQVRAELLAQQPKLERAADLLQQDSAAAAFALVNELNEVWLATMQAVEQASQLLGIDLLTLRVEGRPFTDCTKELLAALRAFRQQVADHDTAAIADALGYEWPRLVEQWDGVLGTLIQQAQTHQ